MAMTRNVCAPCVESCRWLCLFVCRRLNHERDRQSASTRAKQITAELSERARLEHMQLHAERIREKDLTHRIEHASAQQQTATLMEHVLSQLIQRREARILLEEQTWALNLHTANP
jgi:hypothetical protein